MSTGFSILGILACLASGLLPLGLGAGIGALQKQKSGAAGALAGYGAPAALVLTLAVLIVGRKGMIPSFYPHLVFAAALGIAGAGSAIFLAFCPKKAGFACAAFVGIAGFGTAALGFLEEGGPAALSGLVSYGLALLFSGMGLAQGNAALRKQGRAPVDREFLLISKTRLEHFYEDPLCPFVEVRIRRIYFHIPVIESCDIVDLFFDIGYVLSG